MRIIIFGVLTLLAGCAANNNNWSWYKDGASGQDFNMDNGQCRAQAFSIPNASLFQIVLVQQNCMQGKGWEKRENPTM
jgi:hypothetical protein